jgi:Domain of unknown function (DUF4173)
VSAAVPADAGHASAAAAPAPIIVSERTRRALWTLGAGLAAGIAVRVLCEMLLDRLDVALSLGALALVVAVLAQQGVVRLPPRAGWHYAPLAPLVVALVWRDSATLYTVNLLAIVAGLALAAPRARMPRLARAGVSDYLAAGLATAAGTCSGALPPLLAVDWRELPGRGRLGAVRAAGLGLAAATPVVLVFDGLFRAADPAYAQLIASVVRIDLGDLLEHLLFTAAWVWILTGVLRATFLAAPIPTATGMRRSGTVAPTAVGTALGVVAALFLLFVLVQLRYLFGGHEAVLRTAGLTYAEYARRGFFELVWVAGLSLPLLLVADWAADKGDPVAVRRLRRLAGLVVALLFVILASALERMRLYTAAYGLTETRLYTTAFMGWLALVLGWLVATVLRGDRRRFGAGTLAAGLAVVGCLDLLNPDGMIVRVNGARAAAGGSYDAAYGTSLSADAVPTLLRTLPTLPAPARCAAARGLADRWDRELRYPSRWNVALAAAGRDVGDRERLLRRAGCLDGRAGP